MMKMSILYSLFAVCSLAFCQCDKDGGSASGGNLPFELSVSQWNVPSQGATEEVDLQAPGEWKVKTDYIAGGERWLSVSKTSGAAGQHKLTLSAGNNPSNSTDREALLTVTCGNEQKTISVTQRTHEEVVPEQGRYDVKRHAAYGQRIGQCSLSMLDCSGRKLDRAGSEQIGNGNIFGAVPNIGQYGRARTYGRGEIHG